MLIDTNILVYAINLDSSKNKRASAFLKEHKTNLVIAHQNILETIRVLTHPKFPKKIILRKLLDVLDNLTKAIEIIHPKPQTYYLTLELIKKYHLRSDLIFDSYLAATALSNGVDVIATDNVKDFKKFKEIRVVNPFNNEYAKN